jgi:DNA-binding XRE family transcriptional regulator
MATVPVYHQGVQGFMRQYDLAVPPPDPILDAPNDGLPRIFVLGPDVVLYHGTTRIASHQTKPHVVYEPETKNSIGGTGAYREVPNEEAVNAAIVDLQRQSAALLPNPIYPEGMAGREIDGAALAARRKALGWSQGKLAAQLGTDQNTISRWEIGTRAITLPRMLHLALLSLEREGARLGVRV